jgi:threonine synthase
MPLFQGDSQAIISMNIRKLIEEGYSPEQASAIAYAEAEKYRKARNKK